MATMLNDSMAAAINFMGSARETSASAVDAAKSAVETAKEGTGHAVTSARSTLLDGVHAVTGLASMLRSLQPEDALGWVGLARRRSPLLSFAVFTAGFAAGAGAGLLFAPTSGADLRKTIFQGLRGLMGDAKDVAEKAEAKVEKIEDKAEKMAGKAKDKVEHKAAAATSAVKESFQDAKSMVAAATDPAHDRHMTNEPNKTARNHTNTQRHS